MNDFYTEILEYINTLQIIDTHEHLPCFESDRDCNTDILKEYLSCYFNRDLISSGLSLEDYQKVINIKFPIKDRWKIVEPFWEVSRYTGFGRALDISVKELYGIDEINSSTIEELNDKFLKSLKPGHFNQVLKEKSKIKFSLLNVDVLEKEYDKENERSIYCDKNFFKPVYIINDLVFPISYRKIEQFEKWSSINICSFSNYLKATEIIIDKALTLGAVALKNSLAYFRTLKFERSNKSLAENDFNNIFKHKHFPDWIERPIFTGNNFQNYMMHYILEIANKRKLVIQIHTGLQESNGNIISNSNPELLTNLFLEYPGVDFDIFHIGYPYQNILTVLAKNFPNVFIDMCWSHIISPNASVNGLIEWIDTVPLNKISAFGGDYTFVDGVYGHQYLARINLAKALAIKVTDGIFNIKKAMKFSEMFLLKNPINILRLE